MTVFNRDYFKTRYRDYARQNPPRKLRWYRTLLERHLDASQPDLNICDIGCGGAYLIDSLSPAWNRFGVDPAFDILQSVHRQRGGILLTGGMLDHFPLKGPFDAVTLFDVLEHVQSPEHSAGILKNILKPGGILLFVVPVYDGPAGALVRLLDKDPTHINRWSRRAWLEWTKSTFDCVVWYGVTRYFLANRYYLHIPTLHGRSFTPAIAVIARKDF